MLSHKNLSTAIRYLAEQVVKVATERGEEYADNDDSLRTFRIASEVFGKCSGKNGECTPSDVARMQLVLKVCRLRNGYKPDTSLDILAYGSYLKIFSERIGPFQVDINGEAILPSFTDGDEIEDERCDECDNEFEDED